MITSILTSEYTPGLSLYFEEKRVYMGLMPETGVSRDVIFPACQTLIEGLNYEKRLLVLMRIVDL
jgi:hypothetical protein